MWSSIHDPRGGIWQLRSGSSYTWGKKAQTEKITIEGMPFYVTPNLASTLRIFRRGGRSRLRPRRLWIDAICINQSNDPERNFQVGQMQEIYAGAEAVLVWLGQLSPTLETGIAFMHEVCKDEREFLIQENPG